MPGPGGTINLTDGDDLFPGIGDDNSGAEWINALNGSDAVLGGADNDTIFGGSGDDELFGDDGDDFLHGGDSNDRLEGGSGNDNIQDYTGEFTFTDAGNGDDNVSLGTGFRQGSVVNGGGGYDTLNLGDTFSLNLLKINNFEAMATLGGVVTGTAKQLGSFDTIFSSGENPSAGVSLALFGIPDLSYRLNLADALQDRAVFFLGAASHDRITTGSGNDTVYAGLGNDQVSGGDGRDDLLGEAGNDTLTGGGSRDTLTGGADNDTYVFQRAKDSTVSSTGDRIIGWGNGDDTIDLRPIDAVPGGADDMFDFIGSGPISGSGGEVRFETTATETIVTVFIDTDAVADMRIVLEGVFTLTAADFLL